MRRSATITRRETTRNEARTGRDIGSTVTERGVRTQIREGAGKGIEVTRIRIRTMNPEAENGIVTTILTTTIGTDLPRVIFIILPRTANANQALVVSKKMHMPDQTARIQGAQFTREPMNLMILF